MAVQGRYESLPYGLAAAEGEMVVAVTPEVHDACAVPEWGPPAAPVGMCVISIEDKPAPLHLGVTQLPASPARHLAFSERKIHVFSGIAVEIVNAQAAPALRK